MADEENNVEEQEIAIETEEQEQSQEEEKAAVASGDEELDSYSKGVQNRIKKLTIK